MAKPKQDDKEQSKRFIEKARELEVDESGEAFERVVEKIVPPKQPPSDRSKAPQEKPERVP